MLLFTPPMHSFCEDSSSEATFPLASFSLTLLFRLYSLTLSGISLGFVSKQTDALCSGVSVRWEYLRGVPEHQAASRCQWSPHLRRKSFNILPLNDVCCRLLVDALYVIKGRFLLFLVSWKFYHKWVLNLPCAFSAFIKMITWFFCVFFLVMTLYFD